jgi:hypothetical protein
MASRAICAIALLLMISTLLSGCGFLSGFSFWEDPAIYAFSVSDVANQVACELQEFVYEQRNFQLNRAPNDPQRYKWVLDEASDVAVKLQLQTDHQGYVNFTGINLAKLGFESLAHFVSSTSSVPSLAAKATARRTRTVEVDFTVSPKPFAQNVSSGSKKSYNCEQWSLSNNPATHLYLKDWLESYFEHLNWDYQHKPIPNQLKIQSVDLTTLIFLAVDVSGGATPSLLGGGSTFIVPINGLGLDYNPDYSHKIDMNMKMCNNSYAVDAGTSAVDAATAKFDQLNPCYAKDDTHNTRLPLALLYRQCRIYADLVPLLPGVTPPQDIPLGKLGNASYHRTCNKLGQYVRRMDAPLSMPPQGFVPNGLR